MKLKFNRFALLPVMCSSCHRYIWMEPYRRSDVWHNLADKFWKENICNECIKKYDVSSSENPNE